MIRNMRPDVLAKAKLRSQAIVKRAPAFFAAQGITFQAGQDDLNAFQVAPLERDGLPFALMRHEGTPIDETEIYLPDTISIELVLDIIGHILTEFDLPRSALRWVRENAETPF